MAVNELIVTAEFVSNILNEPLEEGGGGRVKSVNGMIGDVVLTAEDIGYNDTTIADALDNLADELDDKAAIIVSSASGAIASFPDGSGGEVKSLVAQIEPAQDLHGYDNPWPAGGGRNLYSGAATIDKDDASIYYNVQINPIQCPATLTFSAQVTSASTGVRVAYRTANGGAIDAGSLSVSSSRTSFTLTISQSVAIERIYLYGSTATTTAVAAKYTNIQIEAGSSATSYAPYSNICPISGWTGAEGKRTGANVWDEETESGYISASGGYATNANSLRSKNFCPCVGGETYYFVKPSTYTTTPNICWYDSEQNFISRSVTSEFPAIPAPSNAKYFKISMWDYGATYNHDISINYPSTATEYNAYTASTISVTFPDAAGTVYGGTLDVTNGVLTVDRAMVALSGSTLWTAGTTASVRYYNASMSALDTNAWEINVSTNMFKKQSGGVPYCQINGAKEVRLVFALDDTNYDTAAKVQALLTNTPLQVVYPLATSQTYQLTPQEVTTLLGANNIWFDTGDTSVEYPADTKLYIDKVINAAIAAL